MERGHQALFSGLLTSGKGGLRFCGSAASAIASYPEAECYAGWLFPFAGKVVSGPSAWLPMEAAERSGSRP